jgi:nitrogen fixation protein FixH
MKRLNWGLGIAIVYAVFASGTLTFAWFAMHQPVDLVAPDYYQRALDHDVEQAAEARALALGTRLRVDDVDNGRAVVVTWTDEAMRPREGTATFYRPSNPAWDRQVTIAPDPDGRQRFDLSTLPGGRWRLQLRWTAGGAAYALERDLTVR